MGTGPDRKQDGCRLVIGADEAAAARSAWPDAPIVALVESSEPTEAVLARCAGADVVLPTADLAAGWRDDTPGLAAAVSAATALAERRLGVRDLSRRATHDLGQALSAINLASELAIGADGRNDRLLEQIRGQATEAGVHAWRAGRAGRSSPLAIRPLDLSSVLHRVATVEPDVSVYDSTGTARVLGDEARLAQVLEELIQFGRRSATNQRIDVRFGPAGTIRISLRALGSPRPSGVDASERSGSSGGRIGTTADRDGEDEAFGPGSIAETVNDMGGTLRIDPGGSVAGPGQPVVELSLPLFPEDGRGARLVGVPQDRMAIQTAILEGVLRHAPLPESMETIVAAIEQQLPGTTCSVLLLDGDGCLRHCAGAGLPAAYRDEIDGVAIGYGQGSCGTAAYLARPVIAADVETDRHWTDFKHVALEHDLRSCWSTPILAADGGAVLGTFAVYRPEVWEPDEATTRLVSRFTYLAAVAIGHHRLFNAVAESESRFRSAFEGATAGMALVELDGSFVMVNPALCAMLDTEADVLADGNVLDLVGPDHRSTIADGWARLRADPGRDRSAVDGPDPEPIEVPIVPGSNREPFWVSLRSAPVIGDHDRPPSIYIEIRDITASRRHAVERRARETAEAASRAKSDLLALVSHELRTPLNAMLGFTQVMQLLDLDAEQRAASLDNIMGAGRHLLELINELLDLSQIEAGQRSTEIEDIAVDDVIEEALRILQPLADSRRITIHRDLDPGLAESALVERPSTAGRSTVVRADRQCVRQVLINLVGNAVKFTPAGGRVGIVVGFATDDRIRIHVLDSGPGIPPEALDGLFQPFHRLAPGADPKAEGTGLGLSVSARLVEEMAGRIGVASELGVGSCFWVDLPGFDRRAEPVSVQQRREESTVADKPDTTAIVHRTTTGSLLYIEDDPACVRVMTAALALRPEIDLLTVGTAAEGMAVARSGRVDAVLLDVGLPDGSGWDLLRRLREEVDTASLPVMILTAGPGTVPPDVPDPALIMTKPLDVVACIESIDDLLTPARTSV